MQITKSIFICFVMSGSSKGNAFEQQELESTHRPRFGRNWWFWVPAITSNSGKFGKDECTNVDIYWLCFSLGLTVFPRN